MARFGAEGSQPDDPDGLFDDQDMPAVDGEMSEGGAGNGDAEEDADRAAMRGQLDDSMNALEPEDDEDEAARGIPQ